MTDVARQFGVFLSQPSLPSPGGGSRQLLGSPEKFDRKRRRVLARIQVKKTALRTRSVCERYKRRD